MCIQMYILYHAHVGFQMSSLSLPGQLTYHSTPLNERLFLPLFSAALSVFRCAGSRLLIRWREGSVKAERARTTAREWISLFALHCFQPSAPPCIEPRPPLACSIRWYDPLNVQWSPTRPLIWTLYWGRWWCSSCGQGQKSPCWNVPFYLLFFFLFFFSLSKQCSSVLQHYSACHQTNCPQPGGFMDLTDFFSDVITKHYSWFCLSWLSHRVISECLDCVEFSPENNIARQRWKLEGWG